MIEITADHDLTYRPHTSDTCRLIFNACLFMSSSVAFHSVGNLCNVHVFALYRPTWVSGLKKILLQVFSTLSYLFHRIIAILYFERIILLLNWWLLLFHLIQSQKTGASIFAMRLHSFANYIILNQIHQPRQSETELRSSRRCLRKVLRCTVCWGLFISAQFDVDA